MPAPVRLQRVLVANRGEIAIRVCRGLIELGIAPIAVHSDVDREATHVLAAPEAIGIGGESAAESYLDIAKVIAAAEDSGAQAIHPGYGFLSENPEFARAVEAAGLVFIGPSAEAMEALGSKHAARAAAQAAGVPVIPGYDRDDGDDRKLIAQGRQMGFPLLVKASAGGGGKGMRVVERESDLEDAIAAGRREARAAFGDDHMLLERRVFPARHVEIQVFGDAHGNAVSLHERECSVQRRHQKVVEEAPSPAVGAELRARMGEAAARLVQHSGYRNAGTVEFLVDDKGAFYFLEVNTRLQVEHPVTELVTGLDLVHLQVRIAEGHALPDLLGERDLTPRGHAIEVRIYAESPETGYLPASGRLAQVIDPEGPGIRVDSGVHAGVAVPMHYDPLLTKLVVHAPDRASACRRLSRALADTVYLGVPTNIDFLRRVIEHPDFVAGRLRTDFLDLQPELAAGPAGAPPPEAYVAAMLSRALGGSNGARVARAGSSQQAGPWQTLGALRLWEDAR
jgi:3-methylcrotonyl-CoA carboxylase alpha subunit